MTLFYRLAKLRTLLGLQKRRGVGKCGKSKVIIRYSNEDVRNFGSKDIIGASNPGLYHDHENNQYQHETQIS